MGGSPRRCYAGAGEEHGSTQVPMKVPEEQHCDAASLRQTQPGSQLLLLLQGIGASQAEYSW
jgi:hypothetical protein